MLTCASCGRENPADARFCNACGAPIEQAPRRRQDVRKLVTVLFTDIAGSTALGERLDPESVRDLMTRYFTTLTEVIERHGGTVEKYIGDAVMAVFGIPQAHEDDAFRAIRAAIDMRGALALLNEQVASRHRLTIEIRTGINTGEVVAGESSTRQALITGDTVIHSATIGEFGAARTYSREVQSFSEEIGLWYALTGAYEASGFVEAMAGNYPMGAQLFRQAFDALLARGDRGHASTTDSASSVSSSRWVASTRPTN